MWHAMNTGLRASPQTLITMNSRSDLLFISVHGAFLSFDPTTSMDEPSKPASSTQDTAAKKGVCGQCTICKCKRASGMD